MPKRKISQYRKSRRLAALVDAMMASSGFPGRRMVIVCDKGPEFHGSMVFELTDEAPNGAETSISIS